MLVMETSTQLLYLILIKKNIAKKQRDWTILWFTLPYPWKVLRNITIFNFMWQESNFMEESINGLWIAKFMAQKWSFNSTSILVSLRTTNWELFSLGLLPVLFIQNSGLQFLLFVLLSVYLHIQIVRLVVAHVFDASVHDNILIREMNWTAISVT